MKWPILHSFSRAKESCISQRTARDKSQTFMLFLCRFIYYYQNCAHAEVIQLLSVNKQAQLFLLDHNVGG